MKKLIATLTIVLFSQIVPAQELPKSYEALWARVYKLETEALTKSALETVKEIYAKAKKEDNAAQVIKSLLFTSKYVLTLEEDAQLKVITDFKSEIEKAEAPARNVLESYLANLYWQYFQKNRYKFYNRTNTSEKVDETDFRTWDLTTLFQEIAIHFENSLQNAEVLQKIKIAEFEDIIYQQEGSETFRPTLFDLLAHNALTFYKTSENSITRPADKFEINNPEWLCDAYTFAQLKITDNDSTSLQLRALKLYQRLVAFHFENPKLDALVDVDIERLSFIYNNAVFDEKDRYYEEVLQNTVESLKHDEVSALYRYELASLYQRQGNTYTPKTNETHRWKLKDALAICEQVEAQFPNSRGAKKCAVLKLQILSKNLQLTSESYIPVNKVSRILVNYKNHESLDLKAYEISRKELEQLNDLYPPSKQYAFIKKLKAKKSWSVTLKNEKDYQSHSIEIQLPALPNGQFLILATPNGIEKNEENPVFAFSKVQVTNLVVHEHSTPQEKIFQVIDRNNGAPKKDAKITLFYRRNYKGPFLKKYVTTDNKGLAAIPLGKSNLSIAYVKVEHEGEKAYFGGTYINKKQKEQKERITYQTFLFKDRSIYRPGQPLYFKGILIERDGDASKLVAEEDVTVGLYNVNGEMVTELDLETNEYGSFSGEFVLPNTGLNGEYYLEAYGLSGLINNIFYFSVEEYKRPKFETTFNPVTGTFKVNDSITVKGNAKAYAGSTISDAKVSYRVQRNVSYPQWYYWRRSYFYQEPQEISHGEAVTDAEGNYEITFKAIPDLSSKKENLPIFSYTVTADVTDINGETRSTATNVNVGYHAMTATIGVASKLDKNLKNQKISVYAQNLNGQSVPATGNIKMYKLKAPDAVLRPRPWAAPDYKNWNTPEFRKLYPHDAYEDEHNATTWEKGQLVWESTFDTEKNSELLLKNIKKWTSGKYVLELESKDKFGQKVKAKAQTMLFNEKEKKLADNQLFNVQTDNDSYKIGDIAEISFYSSAENVTITYWVEKDKKINRTGIIKIKNGCESVQVPVLETDEGGFVVNYSFSVYNSYQSGSVYIAVPYPTTNLTIETNTFRDKIQPGTDETWSFTVKGPKGEKVSAELLASMYDASLDEFRSHSWYFNPIQRPYYYSVSSANANLSFGIQAFRNYNPTVSYPSIPTIGYDQLEWFGLSLNNSYYAQRNYLNRYRNKLKNVYTYNAAVGKGVIEGIVYDSFGKPLPGANILILGSKEGTQTDFDGKFKITVHQEDELIFSYIGYQSFRKKVDENNFFKIYLREDSAALEEVVVTGYGVQKRKAATGAISAIREESMEMEADDFAGSLEGKAAGVEINAAPTATTSEQKDASRIENKKAPNFDNVKIRKNLQETAFFFPHLLTDKEGNVSFSFTSPEALTRWKVQLMAHTKDLKSGAKTQSTVTQKELMVLPNLPRFLREGDTITISSKIANLSDKNLEGYGQLELTDALTGKVIDVELNNTNKTQEFSVDAKGNTQLSWVISIPKGTQAVQYKIVAKAKDFSDGEQSILPVLSNRMLVTETLPMWIRSNQTKTFVLEKLKDNTSTTLSNHRLTLEITSNPAWYAVQALPYLMEYPYECNEQTFSRYYANSLAAHIANSNPRIREVFDQWRNSDALLSNLEKNQELKSILIQETPWLRDAQSETEQKKRIALLFDLNKMKNELELALRKLRNNQLASGAWPWFQGGRENRYITQHIITGLGHLQKLTADHDTEGKAALKQMIKRAVDYLDDEFVTEYNRMKKYTTNINDDHLSHMQLHYLYMRSFFKDIKTPKKVDEIKDYYLGQSKKYWTKRNLYSKGLLALILHRNEQPDTANRIIRSLRENSIVSDEMGMYWKENTNSWYWYQAPIETQALLIEAFSEIDGDIATIDNLKIWLLKNKQTNQWKTTKATTDAVYALLLQGSDWLSVTEAVDVLIGGEKIEPSKLENVKIEAGTGYYKTVWNTAEIESNMAEIQLSKKGNGIAWGALYWQYFEDLDKITSAETPLQFKKKLFLKKNTDNGEQITEIVQDTNLKIGDLVRVRVELKADRAMEFVHMKDMRASGFEPVNVISRYKWQDGLGYYESTKDASTNFFFDYLPKGVYVFEYDLRVNNAGDFSNGITTIQSMYAPEFSSHSEGVRISVQN
ncbi:carboxypeptidase-like regulatory domain-containing protein [Maribacter sp. 2210JD10-5]|uniref:alpha-2-macroglobulin family protein n=1 Tax=Maribacter sp. 2210JD10-5 TaxID=3386272 RepID=UPI0039BC9142